MHVSTILPRNALSVGAVLTVLPVIFFDLDAPPPQTKIPLHVSVHLVTCKFVNSRILRLFL